MTDKRASLASMSAPQEVLSCMIGLTNKPHDKPNKHRH